MKYFKIVLVSISILLVPLIIYFLYPISGNGVIEGSGEIEKITNVYYTNESGQLELFETEIKGQELVVLLEQFEKSKYNRRIGYKNIANEGKYLSLLVFYGADHANYHLEINDRGDLVVNKKTYKILENETEIFNQIYTSIFD